MKLVSISLYGEDPKYLEGAVVNALLMPEVYPGWVLRLYCEESLQGRISRVRKYLGNTQVYFVERSYKHSGMYWRFLPAWESGISHVIFRDADSRLNVKEALAVDAWIESGKDVHCMHDHEHHRSFPIFGGMWGIRGGILRKDILEKMIGLIFKPAKRVDDMRFLERVVYPVIKGSILRHSSVDVKWPYVPFPPCEYTHFVGQQFDENDCPINQ